MRRFATNFKSFHRITSYNVCYTKLLRLLRYKLSSKDSLIKQLEMENELFRDFLKEIGRG